MTRVIGDDAPPVEGIVLGRVATVPPSPISPYITGTALPIDGGQLRSL